MAEPAAHAASLRTVAVRCGKIAVLAACVAGDAATAVSFLAQGRHALAAATVAVGLLCCACALGTAVPAEPTPTV